MKEAEKQAEQYRISSEDTTGDVKKAPEYQRLVGDLQTVQASLEEMKLETEKVRADDVRTKTKIALVKVLKDKTMSSDFVADSLITGGRVGLNGNNLEYIDNGARISIDDGLTQFFTANPNLKSTPQNGGGSSNGGAKPEAEAFTREKLLEMKRASGGSIF